MVDGKDPKTRIRAMIDAITSSKLDSLMVINESVETLENAARVGVVPSPSTFNTFARARRRLVEALQDVATASLAVEAQAAQHQRAKTAAPAATENATRRSPRRTR